GITTIGDRNLLLAYSHIAHDCLIGDDTTFSNNAQLAGHVVVGDYAVLGGFVGVHQFCRIGAHAMIAAGSIVLQDVPPFVTAAGYPAKPRGVNVEGLRRRGFSAEDVAAIRRAYRTLYRAKLPLEEARNAIAAEAAGAPAVKALASFLDVAGRGITIGIVAGEASGDALGAELIGAVRARLPAVRFAGIAGPRMEAAGCEAWYPFSRLGLRGYAEVAAKLPGLVMLRRELRRRLLAARAALFIGIDAPDFNLGL